MESILLLTSYNPFDTCQNLCLYSIETITLGDKRIGIRTSVLEEKATACNMLCCYADELKEGFFPWIDQVRYRMKHIRCLIFSSLNCSFPTYIINTNLHVGCPHIGPSAEVLLPWRSQESCCCGYFDVNTMGLLCTHIFSFYNFEHLCSNAWTSTFGQIGCWEGAGSRPWWVLC